LLNDRNKAIPIYLVALSEHDLYIKQIISQCFDSNLILSVVTLTFPPKLDP